MAPARRTRSLKHWRWERQLGNEATVVWGGDRNSLEPKGGSSKPSWGLSSQWRLQSQTSTTRCMVGSQLEKLGKTKTLTTILCKLQEDPPLPKNEKTLQCKKTLVFKTPFYQTPRPQSSEQKDNHRRRVEHFWGFWFRVRCGLDWGMNFD